jgi:hypothetical protein
MDAPGDDVLPFQASSDDAAASPLAPEGTAPPGASGAELPLDAAVPSASSPGEPVDVAVLTPEPEAPPPPPFYQRPVFRRSVVVLGVLIFLFVLGLLLPPNFWRF